jgi:hypothetical protein
VRALCQNAEVLASVGSCLIHITTKTNPFKNAARKTCKCFKSQFNIILLAINMLYIITV